MAENDKYFSNCDKDERVERSLDQDYRNFIEMARENKISVIIPARNEEKTIGKIVSALLRRYGSDHDQLINLIVIDDHSDDGTAEIANRLGAKVVSRSDPNKSNGKAETVLEGIAQFPSDIYVLFDADVSNFSPIWLEQLCKPLGDSSVVLSKATYQRPITNPDSNTDRFFEGGRVTELVARPLLSLFFPELAKFGQPLSGEVAFRHGLIESSTLSAGYGLDVGLLIDAYLKFSIDSIQEVDLGQRTHSHQELSSLSSQALQVASAVMRRAGIDITSAPGYEKIIRPGNPDEKVPLGELRIR